jgi:hypothetical protein
MKMTVFCDVAPCSLVETDRRFRDSYCLHHQGGRNIPEDSTFNIILSYKGKVEMD